MCLGKVKDVADLYGSTSWLQPSIYRAVEYLCGTQHSSGSWTEFWLPVGASDAWVTAYVALALLIFNRSEGCGTQVGIAADRSIRRAVDWILCNRRLASGWGYNSFTLPDADSTSYAIRLLAGTGVTIPQKSVDFLIGHWEQGAGFGTYKFPDRSHRWNRPCPDVTSAAALALLESGIISIRKATRIWTQTLEPLRGSDGTWQGYWWVSKGYPTSIALELWAALGWPGESVGFPIPKKLDSVFDAACWVQACIHSAKGSYSSDLVTHMTDIQDEDGAFPSGLILKVPPSHERLSLRPNYPQIARDTRRIFTTATALRSLVMARDLIPRLERTSNPDIVRVPVTLCKGRRTSARIRISLKEEIENLLLEIARVLGFRDRAQQEILKTFQNMSRKSLSKPVPWPSKQLSVLSGGMPFELSVPSSRKATHRLRYAMEVGNVYLSAPDRAESALEDLSITADGLGMRQYWERFRPSIEALLRECRPISDGTRFLLWGGVEHTLVSDECISTTLKMYVNLMAREFGNAQDRLRNILSISHIPVSVKLKAVLDYLDSIGFPQEVGFGMSQSGHTGCKIYYELSGWDEVMTEKVCRLSGMPLNTDNLIPAIPGILSMQLARKSRSGISILVHADTGSILSVTTTAAFPPCMLSPRITMERVERWLYDLDMDTSAYTEVSDLLLPKWEIHGKPFGRLHSLFTRTCTPTETGVSIYLRPLFETLLDQEQEPVYNWETIEQEHYSQPETDRNGVE